MSWSELKIAVNVQPMLHSDKSGIGYYEQEILKNMVKNAENSDFILQYFDPRHRTGSVSRRYERGKAADEPCRWFSATLYQLLWAFIPVPYGLFFPSKPDVSMFFNYYLPPLAKGKKLLVVYDTVIKDHPETMSLRTKTMLTLTLGRSIRRADRIITISRFSKQQIMKHFGVPEERISVIPCAADGERFCPVKNRGEVLPTLCQKYGIEGDYYLYLGNLEPRKNITRLIEAYAEALSRVETLPQLVIGGGKGWQYEGILRRAGELGISERVVFTGYVEDCDVPLLMGCARAFCFPSLYEGFGMPPLEAMSCGVPVIVSDCTSLPEVTGECGIAVDPYSTSAIADALIKMTDDEFCAEQSSLGLRQARKFSWEKSADRLLEIIGEMCDEKA